MKMKTKKLLELLKSGLVLFGISLVLWNCTSNDTIAIEEKLQVFEPIQASEAQSIISNIIEEQKLRRVKTSPIKIDHSSLNFIEVKNTNISIPTFSATWNEKIKTKVFLIKKNGIAYPCLYHLVPFKDQKLTNNLFSGGIIITTIENEFINGYKVEEGVIYAKYIRKDSSSSESSRKADDSEFNCSGAAWCDSLNEVNIYSSNDGGSSSGSGSINIITSNPVSSQGWMISLSGDNVSGGAVGGSSSSYSNSGDGGESSGNLLSLFNCDNPTPKGCENENEEEKKEEEEEEEQIFNELTGKADCIYRKMVDGDNNINWILENFKDGSNPSEFDLRFEMSTTLGNLTNASTVKSGNIFIIKINQNRSENINTVLTIARTILHEGIHARLREFASREGSNETSFPGVYDYFRNYGKNWDHQQMASHYRNTIAKGLKQFDNGQHSDAFYNALAWEGLSEIKDLNGNQDKIYTEAWKELSTNEQQEILNTISYEKQNGNKTCE